MDCSSILLNRCITVFSYSFLHFFARIINAKLHFFARINGKILHFSAHIFIKEDYFLKKKMVFFFKIFFKIHNQYLHKDISHGYDYCKKGLFLLDL